MDVRCSTRGEPWDVDYLRFESIHETDLGPAEADAWCELVESRLTEDARAFHPSGIRGVICRIASSVKSLNPTQ